MSDTSAKCPICNNALISFLFRQSVPVHQQVVYSSEERAIASGKGTLDLRVCDQCFFVTNAAFDRTKMRYGEDYENRQELSNEFEAHVQARIESLLQAGIRNRTVIEVGCGNGLFLSRLCEAGNNQGIGYDPSCHRESREKVRFEKVFFEASDVHRAVDAILSRHVIEHIDTPVPFLQSMAKLLDFAPHASVWLETPDLEWILKNHVYWDFFYEHCSYFSKQALTRAAERSGLMAQSIESVFYDQYLWFRGGRERPQEVGLGEILPTQDKIHQMTADFQKGEQDQHSKWQDRIAQLYRSGPVVVWGAGAKGVTFANWIDPHRETIDCLVDINPSRQNKFLAGTGHIIVSPENILQRKIRHVIVMNPNYANEIQGQLQKLGSTATLHIAEE